jgi:hypothetical protein
MGWGWRAWARLFVMAAGVWAGMLLVWWWLG